MLRMRVGLTGLQELLRYLCHVSEVWKKVVGESDVPPEAIDRDTVERLESRAPSASHRDREIIEEWIRSGVLFRSVSEQTQRDKLLTAVVAIPGLIPSLRSFFENLKYIEPCCNILKKLLPAKEGRSIYKSFAGSYFPPGEQTVEHAERKRKKVPKRGHENDLWLSYVQLWAFCMRHFPSMTQFAPRKELGRDKPASCSNTSLWHYLGDLAVVLGFRTEQALSLRTQDPYEALVKQLLRSIRPECSPDAALVTRVASILDKVDTVPVVGRSPSLTRENDLPIERRFGRPFEDDFAEDKDFLFVPFIYESERSIGPDISPFFVKQDIFLSFFGDRYDKVCCSTRWLPSPLVN